MEIRHYVTASGKDPYQQWLDKLKDLKGRVVIQRRIDRLTEGNFGDHKFCQEGKSIVLLLCGGSKRTQTADMKEAVRYWRDYQRRQR